MTHRVFTRKKKETPLRVWLYTSTFSFVLLHVLRIGLYYVKKATASVLTQSSM